MMSRTILSIIKSLILCYFCFFILDSCKQKEETNEPCPPSGTCDWPVLYGGGNDENDYLLWILIWEDMSADVQSILNDGKLGSIEERTDNEHLVCSKTPDGFVLKDVKTGEILYTAIDDHTNNWDDHTGFPMAVVVSWSHSPGPVWDTYAQDRGWQKELRLTMQFVN